MVMIGRYNDSVVTLLDEHQCLVNQIKLIEAMTTAS
jgi:hypothetical protein